MLPTLLRTYLGAKPAPASDRKNIRVLNPDTASNDGSDGGRVSDDDEDSDSEFEQSIMLPPVYRIPPQAFLRIFDYLAPNSLAADREDVENEDFPGQIVTSPVDVLLACRHWLESGIPALYANPPLKGQAAFAGLVAVLSKSAAPDSDSLFEYHPLVESLDIAGPAADSIEVGDVETVLGLASNLIRFRLSNCLHISSKIMQSLADYVPNLLHLDLGGCPVGDGYIPDLTRGCTRLQTLNLSNTNVSFKSLDLLLSGFRELESLTLEGIDQADDGENDDGKRSRRSSFGSGAVALQPVARKIGSVVKGATALKLKIVSLAGSKPGIRDMKLLATSLTDAHMAAFLDALATATSSQEFFSSPTAPEGGYNTAPLESLELDGCERITNATLSSLVQKFAGVKRLGEASPPSHLSPTNMLDLIDASTGRLKFLTVSSLRIVAISASACTAAAVRTLVRECGALEELRMDECKGILGTYVADVAADSWAEKAIAEEERRRRIEKKKDGHGSAEMSKRTSTLSIAGVSRLPVPVKRLGGLQTPPLSPTATSTKRPVPPEGWCRLVDAVAIKRVADYDGVL
ncbi:hypothetical protein HDU82_009292 [Entophlyctis luteolus]|nr:hypothetical protein HDU82_009292 [Entophlyctis luteolus]